MNQQQMSPIEYMARLQIAAEAAQHNGRRVDPRVASEMVRLQTFARANFTPQMLANAGRLVEQSKLRLIEENQHREQTQLRERAEQRVNSTVSELTRGMLGQRNGLTKDQVRAVARGEKVNIPNRRPRETQEQRDIRYRAATRALDPAGRGWNEAEAIRRLDAIADANPQELRAMAGSYRAASPEALRQTALGWREERVSHGLQRRHEERAAESEAAHPTPVTSTEPSEDTRRRAAIVDAYLKHSADEMEEDMHEGRSDVYSDFTEEISPSVKNESFDGSLTRRAQIARAYSESED